MKKCMRILTVTVSLDPLDGGKPARTIQFCQALKSVGLDVGILSTSKGFDRYKSSIPAGISLTVLPLLSKRFFIPVWFPGQINKLIQEYDVVQLMGHWNVLNVLVWHAALNAGVPLVVCPAGELAMAGRSRLLKLTFQRLIGKRILVSASGYIAIAENEIEDFMANGITANRVMLLPNGIDPSLMEPGDVVDFRKKFQISSGPIVLFVGRLDPVKGPDLLLEAFLEVADLYTEHQLVYVGPDYGALSDLQVRIKGHPAASQVHFIGYLDIKDKATAYAAADLVVVPSRKEAMSMIVVEAGALRKTVLMSDQCGLEKLAHVDAVCLAPATVAGLRLGLEKLLADEALRKRLADRLHAETLSNFTWDKVAIRASEYFLKIYGNSLSHGP